MSPDCRPRRNQADALLGGTVGEAVGRDAAARHALDAVVADRGGGVQPFLDVAGFELDLALRGAARMGRVLPQTPAKQSACSSSRTDSAFC